MRSLVWLIENSGERSLPHPGTKTFSSGALAALATLLEEVPDENDLACRFVLGHPALSISLPAQSSGPAPDPDGNRIEFQVDSFASTEETNAYMLSEAFASNPIGVQFDPEELADQFRAGVPEARLLARPDGPPAPIPREHGIGTVT